MEDGSSADGGFGQSILDAVENILEEIASMEDEKNVLQTRPH